MSESEQAERRVLLGSSERLRVAQRMTSGLLSEVISETCRRLPPARPIKSSERIGQLMNSEAWTDTVLALIELELPQWQLRRVVYDAGEWHCALSRQRELPDWLDQAIESSHQDLSLALLGAFVAAQRFSVIATNTSVPSVHYVANPAYAPLCCENFS